MGRVAVFTIYKSQVGQHAQATLQIFANSPFLGTALLSFVLGPVFAFVANFAFARVGNARLKRYLVSNYENGLLQMLHEYMETQELVSITLNSRKVYIGYVTRIPSKSPHDTHFTLVLLLSGYRDSETLSMLQTINYADRTILEGEQDTKEVHFSITLSLEHVVSANLFDPDVYQQRFAERIIQP